MNLEVKFSKLISGSLRKPLFNVVWVRKWLTLKLECKNKKIACHKITKLKNATMNIKKNWQNGGLIFCTTI